MSTAVTVQCDRCGVLVDGARGDGPLGFTAGFYDGGSPDLPRDIRGYWSRYMEGSEQIICDACMFKHPGYAHDYGLCPETTPGLRAAAPTDVQPAPVANDKPAVWGLVLADMMSRDTFGREKYGTPLQPHNGRDAMADAYQEALDLAVYLRQALYERDGQ